VNYEAIGYAKVGMGVCFLSDIVLGTVSPKAIIGNLIGGVAVYFLVSLLMDKLEEET